MGECLTFKQLLRCCTANCKADSQGGDSAAAVRQCLGPHSYSVTARLVLLPRQEEERLRLLAFIERESRCYTGLPKMLLLPTSGSELDC